MNNNFLLYNNLLSFNMKQIMETPNDLLYNIQSLKQLQLNIDQLQLMKDGAQMQMNMASLALLRHYILDESVVGPMLFQNLIRKYYSLSDEQIPIYETCGHSDLSRYNWRYITNINVLKRKGTYFEIQGQIYRDDYEHPIRVNLSNKYPEHSFLLDIFYEANSLNEIPYFTKWPNYVCRYSCYIDIDKVPDERLKDILSNKFIRWNWKILKRLTEAKNGININELLGNEGFFAQMGVDMVEETLMKLQELIGENVISNDVKNKVIKKYKEMGMVLYSYLPISKDFIIQHQKELDWNILQRNPHIQWDLELINLYLKKIKDTIIEPKWNNALQGSRTMFAAIEGFLNDELLSDIRKLYYL